MKLMITLLGASALAVTPSASLAIGHGQPASGSISPAHDTGQPGVECEDEGATVPDQSGRDPGQGTPFLNEDSVSGANYAGHKAGINDKNTASSSQYDIACFRGPDRPDGE